MKFYQTPDNKLIQFNPETGVYKLRNTIEREDTRITQEDFAKMSANLIKRDKFSQLMNEYYKNVKHHWVYEFTKFRKMPNFESNEDNLVLGKDIPLHKIPGMEFLGDVVLVYHWGKVYYHTISYNGYKSGQLIDPRTFSLVRWAQLKHCAPIFNIDSKKIC